MSKIKIWHNPRCSKSRQGISYLNDLECDLEIFEYTNKEIDAKELTGLIESSDQPISEFMRSNEPEFKTLGLAGKSLTAKQFAEIAAKHPKLLQRPIVIKDGKAIVARPTEKIAELLGS